MTNACLGFGTFDSLSARRPQGLPRLGCVRRLCHNSLLRIATPGAYEGSIMVNRCERLNRRRGALVFSVGFGRICFFGPREMWNRQFCNAPFWDTRPFPLSEKKEKG